MKDWIRGVFAEYMRKRTWNLERQVAHLITLVRTDNRWMANNEAVRELTHRYLLALSDTWEQHSYEDVSALRDRLGLTPHMQKVTTPLHDDAYIRGVAIGFPKGDTRQATLLEIADRVQKRNETYEKPEDGWTCFHCGDRFTTPGAARDHFGADPSATPGCLLKVKVGPERGILMALRKAEDELAKFREEDQPIVKEMATLQSRHSDALRDAEELGYSRGLKDYATLEEEYKTCKHSLVIREHDVGFLNTRVTKLEKELDVQVAAASEYVNALTFAKHDLIHKKAILEEVHAWAVCGAITTPDDLMQNLPRIVEITSPPTDAGAKLKTEEIAR